MRNPTAYLRMRVLGAIDMAEGNSIQARIRAVSQMTFTDEDGYARQFTWRTIQTWYSRYQQHGVTVMQPRPRSDKGKRRKVVVEDVLEAIGKVQPRVHGKTPTRALLYRRCIEAGLLTRSQIAPIEAVRDQTRIVDLKQVNHVLLQPHWRKDCDQPLQ